MEPISLTTSKRAPKGFTLIELLIVIALIAILSLVVLLDLNPADLLRQSRDSNRLSDISTLKTALTTYITDSGGVVSIGASGSCYAHASSTMPDCSRFPGGGTRVLIGSTAIDGTGWIPVNFEGMTANAPISVLPVDPVNNATYFYAYKADSARTLFELTAKMESARYSRGGDGDAESTDGGVNADLLEAGSSLSL